MAELTAGLAPPSSVMPRFRSPETAATTDRPSIAMPLKLPWSTFHASTACLPMVSASLFMMQPPVNTSAVRASTYAPVTVPFPPATSGEAARPISAAPTMALFICVLGLGLYAAGNGTRQDGRRGSKAGIQVRTGGRQEFRSERAEGRKPWRETASKARHEKRFLPSSLSTLNLCLSAFRLPALQVTRDTET